MDEEHSSSSPTIWQTYKFPIIFGSIGVFTVVISLIVLFQSFSVIEPIKFSSSENISSASASHMITVDIEGAVARPGVYQMPEGSRIGDALVKAGDVTPDSDAGWIAKTLNRAALITDGGKLYIPKKDESFLGSSSVKGTSAVSSGFININTASEKELDALSGIGAVTAKKIIDGRPYQRIEELLEKKILRQSVFEKVKGQLVI